MKPSATEEELQRVLERVDVLGLEAHLSPGESHTIIGLVGETGRISPNAFEVMPGVERVVRVAEPFKLANREFHPQDTHIQVGDVTIGGEQIVIMAGPCSVESRSQMLETAHAVKAAIDEALEAKEKGEERIILFNFSGHGFLDLGAYDDYLHNKLHNYEHPSEAIQEALKSLPQVD
jgi:hypothetical protein